MGEAGGRWLPRGGEWLALSLPASLQLPPALLLLAAAEEEAVPHPVTVAAPLGLARAGLPVGLGLLPPQGSGEAEGAPVQVPVGWRWGRACGRGGALLLPFHPPHHRHQPHRQCLPVRQRQYDAKCVMGAGRGGGRGQRKPHPQPLPSPQPHPQPHSLCLCLPLSHCQRLQQRNPVPPCQRQASPFPSP